SGHRENSGALRAGPGFTEGVTERGLHDVHYVVKVARRAGADAHCAVERGSGHHAASFTRASGARAYTGFAGRLRRFAGRLSAFAAEGQASRASPQPRASTSWRAPEPTTNSAVAAAAAAAGGRFTTGLAGSPRESNCWTKSS